MADKPVDTAILGLTAQIVSAHAANNTIDAAALPAAIRSVYSALSNVDQAPAALGQDRVVGGVPTRPPTRRPDYTLNCDCEEPR